MCRHKTICGFVLLLILLSGGAICIWNINKGKTEPRIPTIYIFSDGICWDKKEHCDIITTNQGITDTIFGSIKFRGGISSGYPKHSFSLKLTEKYPLAGLKEAKSFIINATYIDKTLMRHKISYDLFRAMSPENEAAECSYANLYLNGQYEGLYVIMDKINAQRLGLDKKESMAMIFKDPPLFWGENRITPQEPDNYFQQTYPKLKKADMNAYMESFMDFLFNAPDSLFAKEIGQWIDISNVIDWHLLLLYTNNGDGVMKNFYLYKKSEQTPFRIVPWDYDHSFGRDGDNELNMLERNVDCERSIL
ncbi:MAG: CotH kinase family protein, partial [Bacteroidales bacterium]|nr:CotH kinase family protein [Bacteroidales bacterium]